MCANYKAPSNELIKHRFGIEVPFAYGAESWPGEFGPMIVRNRESGVLQCEPARFGLLPVWAKGPELARSTYNARSETVAEKPSYKYAWSKGHYCLIPVQTFFEPCYESGKAVRWAIEMADKHPFAIAGMWSWWKNPAKDGAGEASMTMLTLNADEHPLMKRFHKPGDEKRMPYIVAERDYDAWLGAKPEEARLMIEPFPAQLMASYAAPLAARKAAPTSST